MIATGIFWVGLLLTAALPRGYEQAQWGLTTAQLQAQVQVKKADAGTGYGFAEHMEIDPDVYVTDKINGKRIEYYFFDDQLYKVFVVYDRAQATPDRYAQLTRSYTERHGKPGQHYQETYFGFQVQHTQWEDENTVLDLRMGAGFVYEVWLGKELAAKKKQARDRKNAI